jgi:serine/threonine-protein kinase Stk1
MNITKARAGKWHLQMPSENKKKNWSQGSMPEPLIDQPEVDSPKVTEQISDFLSERSVRLDGVPAESGLPGNRSAEVFVDPDATEQILASSDIDVIKDKEKAVSRNLPQIKLLDVVPTREAGESVATQSEHTPLPQGTVLAERYVVLKIVARSSTGQIYKALDRQRDLAGDSEPWVALKVASNDTVARSKNSALLREEYETLLRLRHPNIVAAYDLCRDGNTEFMVLEWLSGQTLARLLSSINSGRLALSTAKNIVCNVASALAYVHATGIVHGDVKPSNIFVAEDHSIKLIDFGAAPLSPVYSDCNRLPLWATKVYASCEVLQGNSPQTVDDIFSLGVTAYRLFSGAWPFGEITALAAKEKGIVPAELPNDALGCGPAVRQALRFDSVGRPSDAAAFLRVLHTDTDTDKNEMPAWATRVQKHQAEIVSGGLALLMIVLAVFWLWPGGESATSAVDRLLVKADDAFAGGQLVEPVGDSALDRYQAILAVEPLNSIALRRLDNIAVHFLDRARLALKENRFDQAVANLDEARRVRPDQFSILLFEDVLAAYQRDLLVSARHGATIDIDLANQYLSNAAALSAEDDPAIAALRTQIRLDQANAELEILIRAIDERILSLRLLVPNGDSALDVLQQAKSVAPDNLQVQRASDRIANALLFQAWFATSNGKFDAAQSYIDAVASLDVRHLVLARAKYALIKARNDAVQMRATQEQVGQ